MHGNSLRHAALTALLGFWVLVPEGAGAAGIGLASGPGATGAAGLTSDIECEPAPPRHHPSTYTQKKKVDAYREHPPAPAAGIGTGTAAPKPAAPKPVGSRPPRRKPSVMQRVRQTCHQVVPAPLLELAGLPPIYGDLMDETPNDPVVPQDYAINFAPPCAEGECVTMGAPPIVYTPGATSSSSGSSGGLPPDGSSSGGAGSSSGASGGSGASSGGSGSSGAGSSSGGGTSSGSGSGGASGSGSSSGASGSSSGASGSGGGASGSGSSGASGSSSGASGSSSGGTPVPEPGTGLLAALGLAGLWWRRRAR